ncbi:uncharacterized protein LOC134290782 [Aedes albopictus]|uniref:Reverse transcriptase domain-containing protein n=1 Tax=Aedes albopictus TaxID=7160 RepID=A0ABM1XPA4_AEDAL
MQHRQLHICKRPTLSDLNEYVREFFTLESLAIAAAPSVESAEDDRARKILENSTKRTNCGKFETGPDLLTSLLAVMFQFREREVAITADIREMFLQILIRPEDRSALLFLWRDSPEQPVKIMVTDVAIFGATCSPVQSQFVKNLNAAEYEDSYPKASAAIKHKHYVDDYLDSVDTVDEAVQLATDVTTIHGKANFFIRNWRSNKLEVLERTEEVTPVSTKQFTAGKEINLERVLGMMWLPDEDVFAFNFCLRDDIRHLMNGEAIPTKREVLSVVMSLYNPLGLVAVFVVHGKVIIQDTWRANIGWDDDIR